MKYKYVFEAPDDFELGCCANCPLSFIDWSSEQDLSCPLNCSYEECPLEKTNIDKIYELVNTLRKYVTELAKLNYKDAKKLDVSDWQHYLYNIAMGLVVIEAYINNEKGE